LESSQKLQESLPHLVYKACNGGEAAGTGLLGNLYTIVVKTRKSATT
jgi:hypothetical protein